MTALPAPVVTWFRADGGATLGLGHLVRCAALASALHALGVETRWATRSPVALERVTGAGSALALPGDVSSDRLPRQEAAEIAARATGAHWLVLDHYGADAAYLRAFRRAAPGTRILLVEDHLNTAGADLRLAPLQPPAPDTLTGVEHLLLRPDFVRPTESVPRRGHVVCLGGADPLGHTRQVVEHLHDLYAGPLTVVASDVSARSQGLDEALARRGDGSRRVAWADAPTLAALLAGAEGALVSASMTALETAAARTPMVALHWIDNQRQHAEALARWGVPVTRHPDEAAAWLAAGRARSAAVSIDGGGALRVARRLLDAAAGQVL